MKFLLIILSISILTFFGFYVSKPENVPQMPDKLDISNKFDPTTDAGGIQDEVYVSPISVNSLRSKVFQNTDLTIESTLSRGSNYSRFIASYTSDGNKIYGLLTIPDAEPPEGGFSAIVFNHGYIPPSQYRTTEKYLAYVDTLARNGFVVFKIDLRGHGESEGIPTGSYFSPGYTIDALYALKALQTRSDVNPKRIGMWGHSMAGNLVLRAMLVSDEIKAGVIWAGAVYSYKDFGEYRLNDNSYSAQRTPQPDDPRLEGLRENSPEIRKMREDPESVDFSSDFWKSISLTQNLNYLNSPIQLHHSVNDDVVNVGYSRDLVTEAELQDKDITLYEYSGGGHNINSPYFEQAIQRTVDFFKENL